MAYQFQSVASVSGDLVRELGFNYAQIGTLIGLYMLPGIFIALPGGVLGQRFGDKRVVLLGLLIMTVGGVISGLSTTYAGIAAGRVLTGVGGVLINVLMTKMVADWFGGREIATSMAVLVTSWPLGLALGLLTFPIVSEAHSWGGVMIVAAAVCLLSLVLIAAVYRPPQGAALSDVGKFEFKLSGSELSLLLAASIIWMTYNVSFVLLISFAPGLFEAAGKSAVDAAWLVSLAGWAMIVTSPLCGMFADRFGRQTLIMASVFVVVGAALVAMSFATNPMSGFLTVAIVMGLLAGLIMALPAGALTPANRATGMGLFFTVYYVGMAFLPSVAGWTRDAMASAGAPIIFAAGIMAVSLLALMGFRKIWTLRAAKKEKCTHTV